MPDPIPGPHMTAGPPCRHDRLHSKSISTKTPNSAPNSDLRTPFERDRDRILYSEEFRRMAGITQVARGGVRHLLHNRLTHVLEVAQIGRSLAEKLLREKGNEESIRAAGGLDPAVVEAACLAHDLGHPPFGHIAEKVLCEQARSRGVSDGFEGNAQSFRIVTKLAIRRPETPGLNLTRATLDALLKYPWLCDSTTKKSRKWNAYASEKDELDFARGMHKIGDERKSIEAEVMDWADDIAYSVHDLQDFYEAGRIPLDKLVRDPDERERFLAAVKVRWGELGLRREEPFDPYRVAFNGLMEFSPPLDAFIGTRDQRSIIRAWSSSLIDRYVGAAKPTDGSSAKPWLDVADYAKQETTILKELTWHYVIRHPSLAVEQYGQQQLIKHLFDVLHETVADKKNWAMLPASVTDGLEARLASSADRDSELVRTTVDLIAGMTEQQAVELHHRLRGLSAGSGLDDIFK